MDFNEMFIPSLPLLEIFVRGTIVYLFLFTLFRIFRRDPGTLNLADLLLIVLVADASQNAMANEYKSVTEGIALVSTLAFWNYLIDWLSFKFPFIEKLVSPAPELLIKNGRIIPRGLRNQMISRGDLYSHLREKGIENISDVKICYLEGEGNFSVIKKDDKSR